MSDPKFNSKASFPFSDPWGSDISFDLINDAFQALGVNQSSNDRLIESLPFSLNDVTAGSESELQAAVIGNANNVDLPVTIKNSNFFSNVIKRSKSGETPRKVITDLENILKPGSEKVWDNSWVRFPRRLLSEFAGEILGRDLLKDKSAPEHGTRTDIDKFLFKKDGEDYLRVPLSYLLKLALADVIGSIDSLPGEIFETATEAFEKFANDNTSPETHSFYVSLIKPSTGGGKSIARETSKRFLLTQLLISYANRKFDLKKSGQNAVIFHSPRPAIMQKNLNDCISDSFYRELFMSPCLSGWDKGEEKHRYMKLCHEVLSRSQLNTIAKLRECGIITRNLVVLPNTSNISLANNGTHLSVGSLMLSDALKNKKSVFTEAHEKYIGDLAIKVVEHFLPLFVGTYSSAPYRMEFADFHPEQALGFLPHELHYTHLRMIWRRWTKKAKLKIFNKPVTPFGPLWLDKLINKVFGFRGDYIPDFRLIDYLVGILSTENCPSLDGGLDSEEKLKNDLMQMGVFDERMSLYLLCKLRRHSQMGYSGFEGRYYSLFYSINEDMGHAANLQILTTLYAYKLMAKKEVDHRHIQDLPFVESERRQIFFGAALNIPTFYVRDNSKNLFLRKILRKVKRIRSSARYPGYLRIHNLEYQKALINILQEEAGDLIELLNMQETIRDLNERILNKSDLSTCGKITKGIIGKAGVKTPFELKSEDFNASAESYYRNDLRLKHFREGLKALKHSLSEPEFLKSLNAQETDYLRSVVGQKTAALFLDNVEKQLLAEDAPIETLEKVIGLLLMDIKFETKQNQFPQKTDRNKIYETAPVY